MIITAITPLPFPLFRGSWTELFTEPKLQGHFHLCQAINIAQAVSQEIAVFAGVKDVNIWPVEPVLSLRMQEMEQRVIFTCEEVLPVGLQEMKTNKLVLTVGSWVELTWKETPEPSGGLRTVTQRQNRVTEKQLSYSSAMTPASHALSI